MHVLLRPSTQLLLISDLKDKINVHRYAGETSEIIEIVHSVRPDTIFHLAACFKAQHEPHEIKELIESNILLGTQLLEAAAAEGVKCFINTGTHWQNYDTCEYCPSDLYAATKQALETIADYYISAFGISFVTLKLIDTYGPFDPRPKLIPALKMAAQSDQRLDMSPGEQQIGLVYIDDVVKAFVLAALYAEKMPPGTKKSFIAAPKEIYTLREVSAIFENALGKKLNIEFGRHPYRKREVMDICCGDENILLKTELVGLYEGLQKVFKAECEI
ncbi:CDP-3, 6-dideoxy-D-glycero-L-glycero-4-hexulose-4-reductase [Anaerobacterium chartisolvens]|uniref:CDP-3, 6-dideoxy-D-glycero-L-glycero-4-hexulose-4-reductase n=1 Tax=Anaerobacterium chartisolvens TaxID=1297424 RepID=A0A369B5X0_9FIRM|nr:CDP-3, 6-dideoxy-D-glycero-L-glycero-4-hexulose-4-reductase [Anaerobacterium chartisolvens]